jgi:hypothetical protein
MVERTLLKQEIKRLKAFLSEDFDRFLKAKSTSASEVSMITSRLWKIHEYQCKLNATYKPMDERVILERVAKRRGKK